MEYSNYRKVKQVTEKFALSAVRVPLFSADIEMIIPSVWLTQSLVIASAIPLTNEKAKSERLISPILSEVHLLHKDKVTLFSGEELSVSPEEDLNGACDFFFAANPNLYFLEAPVIACVEAKDEDMEWGTAQVAAQMVAAQRYNQVQGKPTPTVWGCATTAGEWRFLKLTDKSLYIDEKSYYIDKLDLLLGVFHQIIEQI